MVNTYTPKLNLAKPAHGDVNWHTPINENFDILDTEVAAAKTITGTIIDADKNWNGKNITNVGYIQAGSMQVSDIKPRICVASDVIRYESLPLVSCYTSHKHGPETMTLKSKRIPAGSLYFFSENYQMSVRVTARLTHNYIDFPTEHPNMQFWISVDGEIRWTKDVAANYGTVEISTDINVNPNSMLSLGASRKSSGYHSALVGVDNFRIGASDQFINSPGW
jgi:hypothetical protein